MGGSLAEGIELPDTGLQGVVIIGTGMPPPDQARDWQRRYWQQRTGQGFAYAYQLPGIQRIIQSAGRIQRRDSDRGVVVLLEERFFQRHVREPFPEHWRPIDCATPDVLGEKLARFWRPSQPDQRMT
jgi:Rad3-related DNA helicase